MAMQQAKIRFEGRPDEGLTSIPEVDAIEKVTGLPVSTAYEQVGKSACAALCGRDDCRGGVRVERDRVQTGTEPAPIAGMLDYPVYAPVLEVTTSCATEGCDSFYQIAAAAERVAPVCMQAATRGGQERAEIMGPARARAAAISGPAEEEAAAILAEAHDRAEAIRIPALDQASAITRDATERADAVIAAVNTTALAEIGLSSTPVNQ